MPRNDVAIYSPGAACLYERRPEVTGGAERQTTLLAEGLVRNGFQVAHIVLPVREPDPGLDGSLMLVERELVTTKRGPLARSAQMSRIWSALAEADANVYVVRTALPAAGVIALFCRIHRRRLIYSASSNLDFTFELYAGRRPELEVYKLGVRNSAAVVVQTSEQAELARRAFPRLPRVVELPSFAEEAERSTAQPEAFLWVGRLDATKQPLRYVELAEAVPEAQFRMVPRRLDPLRSGGSPGGEGPDPDLEREVMERAARLSNLELCEQRPHSEAMKLVDRSVAVVNTGPVEGLPNVFLEAWARGVPALTFQFDPDGRIAEHGLGITAEGSVERFHEGARQLWRGRDDRGELSRRVRGYLESAHGLDAVSSRWMDLIAELRAS